MKTTLVKIAALCQSLFAVAAFAPTPAPAEVAYDVPAGYGIDVVAGAGVTAIACTPQAPIGVTVSGVDSSSVTASLNSKDKMLRLDFGSRNARRVLNVPCDTTWTLQQSDGRVTVNGAFKQFSMTTDTASVDIHMDSLEGRRLSVRTKSGAIAMHVTDLDPNLIDASSGGPVIVGTPFGARTHSGATTVLVSNSGAIAVSPKA